MGTKQWHGAEGLAEDIRYYGKWMRDEAEKRIGHLYPKVEIRKEMAAERPDLEPYVGQRLTVIAWLWARTVKSPNPAFSSADIPLVSTFVLSAKKDKEVWVKPIVENNSYRFAVQIGKPPIEAKQGTSAGPRKAFRCIFSDSPVDFEYLRDQGCAGRMNQRLLAIVVQGRNERLYLSPTIEQETTAKSAIPDWQPETPIPEKALSIRVQLYGMKTHGSLFTDRQLALLSTISCLINEVVGVIRHDAIAAGLSDDHIPLCHGGSAARAFAEALSVFLAFAANKVADRGSTLTRWDPTPTQSGVIATFSRQALPMTWDFAESNPLGEASGNYVSSLELVIKALLNMPCKGIGYALADNATSQRLSAQRFVSTDPPYYDNIGYADLSDYFYVWLRQSLRLIFPDLLATITVPKAEELVATPYRHGTKENAEAFFLEGMTSAMQNLSSLSHRAAPLTIYYAFKQSETSDDGASSSGWVTFLDAIIKSGLMLCGTWPMRTELANRMVGAGTNALASSIVLVCRPRLNAASSVSRREFIRELNATLPLSLDAMTRESEGLHSPVAPVDLSQAIIGPGMAVFSKYSAVLEADGTPMTVRTALQLINRFLAEDDFDGDTQFCLHWFEQYGWETGKFGEADTLARAKGTSVDGIKQSGVLHSAGGNVRLLKWAEYPTDWDPKTDHRLPVWEVLHQLIRVFNTDGETGAAAVFAAVQSKAEAARQLAYRLYTLCERKNWAEDARAYNEVVTSWSGIESAAAKEPTATQRTLFE